MRLVVGAVVVDSLARPTTVIATRRTRPPELAGRWEFPGGKVEDGETAEQALVREVREELGATLVVGDLVGDYPVDETMVLRLHLAEGGPLVPGADHDLVRTLALDELDGLDWLPSDRAALPAIAQALGSGSRPPTSGSAPTK